MDVPHALALAVEFVFPRLERGQFSISHLLHGFDDVPVKLEYRDGERLESLPDLGLLGTGAIWSLVKHLAYELLLSLKHNGWTFGLFRKISGRLDFFQDPLRALVGIVQERML